MLSVVFAQQQTLPVRWSIIFPARDSTSALLLSLSSFSCNDKTKRPVCISRHGLRTLCSCEMGRGPTTSSSSLPLQMNVTYNTQVVGSCSTLQNYPLKRNWSTIDIYLYLGHLSQCVMGGLSPLCCCWWCRGGSVTSRSLGT